MEVKSVDKELKNCNFVKTILMLLVVLYHSMLFWRGDWISISEPIYESNLLAIVLKWLDSFHVYGFTLVSGYIFYYLKYEKESYKKFKPFVINKFKRLIIPYIFVTLIWILPITIYLFRYDLSTLINNYVLAVSPSQLWFLWMLFWVFVIVYLISDFLKKHNFKTLILIIILYLIGLIGCRLSLNYFHFFNALRYITFFVIGFKIRQFKFTKNTPYVLLLLPLHIFLYALSLYLKNLGGGFFQAVNLGMNYLLYIVGSLMAFYCLQYVASKINYDNKVFSFFNQRSMIVYLFHQQVIFFIIILFNGIVNPYIHVLINFGGSLIISILIANILMKFEVTRFLLGEK